MDRREIIKTGIIPPGMYWGITDIDARPKGDTWNTRSSQEDKNLQKTFRIVEVKADTPIGNFPFDVWDLVPDGADWMNLTAYDLGAWEQPPADWMHYAGETVEDIKDAGAAVAKAAGALPSYLLYFGGAVALLAIGFVVIRKK
jgi:hypothetical protein